MEMTKKQRENIKYRIESKGIEYTFIYYSHFDEIEDEEFHKQRKAFVEAYETFADYLITQGLMDEV